PDFQQNALKIFQSKKNLRIVKIDPAIFSTKAVRNALGGFLVQDEDLDDFREWKVVTKRAPSNYEDEALRFAWKVCKWVKSNGIVLAIKGRTVGIGAGQPNRVGSVKIAVEKMGMKPVGVVMASDGFFPFRDAVDCAAQAGIQAIIQPGGSIRDQESIDACNEKDIAMVFTGYRHFRH
ncbi:MAG: bifunctional phosphoribosylaminoimidazolecarboxamide formyltransferase/IMP cyclohydrolase, partial [candidate division WOR-3 bacterium]